MGNICTHLFSANSTIESWCAKAVATLSDGGTAATTRSPMLPLGVGAPRVLRLRLSVIPPHTRAEQVRTSLNSIQADLSDDLKVDDASVAPFVRVVDAWTGYTQVLDGALLIATVLLSGVIREHIQARGLHSTHHDSTSPGSGKARRATAPFCLSLSRMRCAVS